MWPHADPGSCQIGPIPAVAGWRPEPVSLGLVLLMFVVFINCCLGFCVVIWLHSYMFC